VSNPNNDENKKIVLFSLDEPRYALYLTVVECVVRVVEITPLPKAPEIVLGVINFHGEIITVIDMRRRFNLLAREIELKDQLIVARTSKRLVALVVDSVIGIHELNHNQVVDSELAFPFTDYLSGAAKIEGNLILINDLDKFLSLDEENKLEIATREMTDES
jgi:purine-binding chemotaxis protein CheW